MSEIINLSDVSALTDIESNFKVYAGPGAGKTSWLISHIEKVLRTSDRLAKTRRIACITYTNVAADEIINRLRCDKTRFEITTIHSFLYRNIIKPFSYHIEHDEDGNELFNISRLDGHDEHIVQGDRYRRWLSTISQRNGKNYNVYNSKQNKPKVVDELSSLDYTFINDDVDLIVRNNRGARIPKSNRELWVYKSKYWLDGIMHHEDVLYFSYLIIRKSPRVLEFIRNKYPYIFVDEFQDTTELQTWIIKQICESISTVGVVGDLAQSIYKFTGAKREDFQDFKKGDVSEYKLSHNHRSTKSITDFLNSLRADISQEYGEGKPLGNQVTVLIGTIESAKKYFATNYPEETLHILTRKNTSVSEINNQQSVAQINLLKELYSNDGNSARARLIHAILVGFKYHQKGDFRNSLKEIIKPIKRVSDNRILKLNLRRIAIKLLAFLSEEENRKRTIFEFYSDLKQQLASDYDIDIGSALHAGRAKIFYERYTLNDILAYIKVDTKSDDLVRTIHSAKGTEFKNTLVHFESFNDFRKYILEGVNQIDANEDDGRIYYVACSRSMEKLFINIPEISDLGIQAITDLNMVQINI